MSSTFDHKIKAEVKTFQKGRVIAGKILPPSPPIPKYTLYTGVLFKFILPSSILLTPIKVVNEVVMYKIIKWFQAFLLRTFISQP